MSSLNAKCTTVCWSILKTLYLGWSSISLQKVKRVSEMHRSILQMQDGAITRLRYPCQSQARHACS